MPKSDQFKRRQYNRLYVRQRLLADPDFKRRHYDRIKKNKADKIVEVKELLSAFRAQGCLVCGEQDNCCLDAHHLDSTQKDGSISGLTKRGVGFAKIKAELCKCVCLCSNCHKKLHAGRIVLARVEPSG